MAEPGWQEIARSANGGVTIEVPLKTYTVKTPDGRTITLKGPVGASQDEIIERAKALSLEQDAKQRNGVLGTIDSAARAVTSGVLMNFDDELVGGINAVLPLDRIAGKDVQSVWDGKSLREAVDHNIALERRINAADAKANPIVRGTGQVAGAIAGTVLGGRVLGAAARAAAPVIGSPVLQAAARAPVVRTAVAASRNPVVRAAAGGAAQGAVSGYGAGDTQENREKSAGTGALVGGALGGTIGATVTGLSPIVGRYWNAFRGRGIDQQALVQIQHALAQDGYDVTSPAGVQALEQELSSFAGKPVSLADVGPAVRARAGVGLRTASGAQAQSIDTVMARQGGQGQRLSGDIRATVAPRTDIHALDENLIETRNLTALPLREAALRQPRQVQVEGSGGQQVVTVNQAVVPQDNVLQQLARLPLAQRALGGARNQAAAERDLLNAQGLDTVHLPEFPEAGAPLDMKSLDYLKRYLDDEVHRAFNSSDSATRAEAVNLRNLRDALRTRMREAVPEYGEYLDTYSDVSEMRDALAQGRGGPRPDGRGSEVGFDRMDPEAIAAGQAGRSQAAQEFYRVGVARRLDDVVNGVNDTGVAQPANRILQTPTARAQLQATGISPEDFARLEQSVAQERQMGLLPRELQNSATDARQAARQNADGGLHTATPFNPSSPASWLAFLARRAAGTVDLARNSRINEAALPRLLAQDPAVIRRTIQELQQAGRTNEAEMLRRAAAARFGARVMGTAIGGPVSLQEGY